MQADIFIGLVFYQRLRLVVQYLLLVSIADGMTQAHGE